MTVATPIILDAIDAARARERRTLTQWATDEVIVPRGPRDGMRFDLSTQPFVRLLWQEIESGRWQRVFIVGPTQSGKSLCAFVVPTLWVLFELGEDVICGLPDATMAADKWGSDILPVLTRTRYSDLLPTVGEGSRGGDAREAIRFRNGRVLRFLTAGGGDKARAGYTSRWLVVTETDGFDSVGGASREATKFQQLEGRTAAFGSRSRLLAECTASTPDGRTWAEYTEATRSRIAIRCPHCSRHVTPEREHLIGWQDAEDVITARESAAFACPSCGVAWSEADRIAANQDCLLVHKGQEVDESGVIVGDAPRTDTLGFRWSAVNNLLVTTGDIAAAEWKSRRERDPWLAETNMRQRWWALPAEMSGGDDGDELTPEAVMARETSEPRRRVPALSTLVTIGADVGRHLVHWTACAWELDGTMAVIDYGRIETAARDIGEEEGIRLALATLAEMAEDGFEGGDRDQNCADLILVDCGYMPHEVYRGCLAAPVSMLPCKGYGVGQRTTAAYLRPRRTGTTVRRIGDGWHQIQLSRPIAIRAYESDANFWKAFVHERMRTPRSKPGAGTLFAGESKREHFAFAQHICAEREEIKVSSRGAVRQWVPVRGRNNHWLDSTALAAIAASILGVEIGGGAEVDRPERPRAEKPIPLDELMAQGRKWT